MAIHNDFGKLGEEMAETWLRNKGYEILYRNWRYSYYEIDIIAKKDRFLHIIEVKIRHSSRFGNPEESVSRRKFKRLQRAADEFLNQTPGYNWLQYGILAITLSKDNGPEFFLIEDVYL